ncbi:hypothetical protein, partial [Pantoea wallisii]|uniref:hypothetical protein n=1 Tax=Pantoea wallisii TaxID=1076551 RepID=UPI001ABF25FB
PGRARRKLQLPLPVANGICSLPRQLPLPMANETGSLPRQLPLPMANETCSIAPRKRSHPRLSKHINDT